jgi:hypothetical protein
VLSRAELTFVPLPGQFVDRAGERRLEVDQLRPRRPGAGLPPWPQLGGWDIRLVPGLDRRKSVFALASLDLRALAPWPQSGLADLVGLDVLSRFLALRPDELLVRHDEVPVRRPLAPWTPGSWPGG